MTPTRTTSRRARYETPRRTRRLPPGGVPLAVVAGSLAALVVTLPVVLLSAWS